MATLSMSRKIEVVNDWLSQHIAELNERKADLTRSEALEWFRDIKDTHRALLATTGIVTSWG